MMFEPGTSMQVLAATLIMLCHLLVVLKIAPYESDGEDYSSFLSSLTLTLTTLGGLALMKENPDPTTKKTFESDALGFVMVGISASCIASQIGIAILFDCGVWDRLCSKTGRDTSTAGGNNTQVIPATAVSQGDDLSARAKGAWEN